MEKQRLDILLVEKGLFESREKARSSIMAGVIYANGERVDKPGTKVLVDSEIFIKKNVNPYVSRGGFKLHKALDVFKIDMKGKITADIGSSTGGFTDCMLKNGAIKVYAIDVGYGQLAWELRNDSRVVCMERTNVRYVKSDVFEEHLDFASIDVSFISLKLVVPVVRTFLKDDGEIVCLIKPQFEAGRDKVGKKGVVRDPDVHIDIITNILNNFHKNGFKILGLDYSPIKGPEGNIEYIVHILKCEVSDEEVDFKSMAIDITEKSFNELS